MNQDLLSDRNERVEELFRAHAPAVLAYALRTGVQLADAEDVVAQTFLVCFRRHSEVPSDALPWLRGVARRVIAQHFRAERRRRALTAKVLEGINDSTMRTYESIAGGRTPVFTAFRRLPLREREVVRLVVLEDLDSGEAAKVLGITQKAVYCHLARARAKLKALLRNQGD